MACQRLSCPAHCFPVERPPAGLAMFGLGGGVAVLRASYLSSFGCRTSFPVKSHDFGLVPLADFFAAGAAALSSPFLFLGELGGTLSARARASGAVERTRSATSPSSAGPPAAFSGTNFIAGDSVAFAADADCVALDRAAAGVVVRFGTRKKPPFFGSN